VVVDASVALKWFFAEEDSERADELAKREPNLRAPALLLTEVANALWRLHRRGLLERDVAMTILREAPRYFREIADAGPLLGRALDIALAFDHPVYDCLYVALAERRGERLVTADRRLLKRFEATPLASRFVALSDWRPDLE
jgi:predicted nucleic acid-binding protein